MVVIISVAIMAPPYSSPAWAGVISRLPTDYRLVALTFDDFSNPDSIYEIVKILKDEGVTATFFINTAGMEEIPEAARHIRDSGFAIGSHSHTHPYLTNLSENGVVNEANTSYQKALDILGIDTRPFFRPPFGAYNNTVLAALNRVGYTYTVLWGIDTRDWSSDTSREYIINQVKNGLGPGSIILIHVHGPHTAEMLPEVIGYIRSRDYGFTDIPRFYGMPQQRVKGMKDAL